MKIQTIKRKKVGKDIRGVLHFPQEMIGKRCYVITISELNKYNRAYWFLINLKRRLNTMRGLE